MPAIDVMIAFDRSRSSYAVTEPPGGCSGQNCIGGKKKLFDVFDVTKQLVKDELIELLNQYGVASFIDSQAIRFAAASFSSDVTVDFDFNEDLDYLETVESIMNICPPGASSCGVRFKFVRSFSFHQHIFECI